MKYTNLTSMQILIISNLKKDTIEQAVKYFRQNKLFYHINNVLYHNISFFDFSYITFFEFLLYIKKI